MHSTLRFGVLVLILGLVYASGDNTANKSGPKVTDKVSCRLSFYFNYYYLLFNNKFLFILTHKISV